MDEFEGREAEKPQPEQPSHVKRGPAKAKPGTRQGSRLRQTARAANWTLDMGLFIAVFVAGIFVCKLLWDGLISQQGVYRNAIDLANTHHKDELIINYARALDFATVKLSALLLGFILAFLGALYVLRAETSTFRATVKTKEASGALQTSSPGLAMLALGVLAVVCTLFSKSYLSNESSEGNRDISVGASSSGLSASSATDNRDGRDTHNSQLSTASNTEVGTRKYELSKFLRVNGTQDALLLPGCKKGELTKDNRALLNQEIERLEASPSQNLVIDVQTESMRAEMALAEGGECANAARSYVVSSLKENPRRVKIESQGKERNFVP